MNKTVITSLLSVGALAAYAQGTLNFTDYDYGTIITHIWINSNPNGSLVLSGNTAADTPAGTQTYTGFVKLGGSGVNTGPNGLVGNGLNFTAQLEALGGATTAVPLSSLHPVTQYTATFSTTAARAGTWTPPVISNDPGIPGAGGIAPTADIAVACWYNAGGTITTLAAAQASGNGIWGESPEVVAFSLTAPSSITSKPQGFNNDQDTVSFSISGIPEPSTIALGLMAAGVFFARSRKI